MDDLLNKFKELLVEENKSRNTINGYTRDIGNYRKWYQVTFGTDFNKLYRVNILDYKSYLMNNLRQNGKTINHKLVSLRRLNLFLIKKGIQDDMVVFNEDFIKVQAQILNPCDIKVKDVEEFRQKILEKSSKRDYAIVTILAYAGLRISECLDLREEEVDLISKEMLVRNGKGGKQRVVYINDKIVNAIKEHLREKTKESKYLFNSQKREKLDRTRVNAIFKKFSDKITPHMLRHFYCTHALEVGYTTQEVASQAGHKDIRTTQIYLHIDREKMKEKSNLL